MTSRRPFSGLLALAVLVAAGFWVASFALPTDKVLFDKWSGGLGPRLWTTWWFLGTFVLGALSFGQLVVRSASKAPRDGAWALAFSSGTITFAAAIGLFAWLGWLAHPFFWLLPLTMTLVGLPSLRDALVESREQWSRAPPFSAVEVLALLFGGVCLALLMLQVITPDNVNYDAMWYHLRSAERNALAGGAVRTPEGDILLTLPSATSWLYTWAFLAPAMATDQKVVLALHLELAVFIGTLALVPPLVRALVPGRERRATRIAWVALFFFPSIFVYDTGLMGGADHVVALWAAAVVLTWIQARERNDAASWALLGLQLTGMSAKYSSLYLLIPLAPMVLADALWRGRAQALWPRVRGLAIAAAVPLVMTVPYWLRNWVWHHNPIYPEAAWLFPNTPWNPESGVWRAYWTQAGLFSNAVTSSGYRFQATFSALIDYHQKIYGWTDMMGDQSVMGSGYFLSMLVLPFLPERRRLFVLAVLLNLGVIVWFNLLQHHMRYLTVLTPLMAAGMAATALSLWEMGWPSRVAVLGLVGLLLSAYGDVPFRHTHRISRHSSPIANADEFIVKRGPPGVRIKMWSEIGAALPPAAKPLVHGIETHLGLPRLTVTDTGGMQVGIDYAKWGSVAEVWRHLREMGVTHLIWNSDVEQPDTVAGEALFRALAKATVNRQAVNGLNLGELPADEPPAEPGTHLIYVGCNEQWKTGVYSLEAMSAPPPPLKFPWPVTVPLEPLTKESWLAAAAEDRIGWVVTEESCKIPAPAGFAPMGLQVILPSSLRYYVRQR